MVHEGLVLLVGEVGLDDLPEERGILVEKEEVQLVAGVRRVFLALFFGLEARPVQDEAELGEIGVATEGREQAVNPGQVVVKLDFGGGDVG